MKYITGLQIKNHSITVALVVAALVVAVVVVVVVVVGGGGRDGSTGACW